MNCQSRVTSANLSILPCSMRIQSDTPKSIQTRRRYSSSGSASGTRTSPASSRVAVLLFVDICRRLLHSYFSVTKFALQDLADAGSREAIEELIGRRPLDLADPRIHKGSKGGGIELAPRLGRYEGHWRLAPTLRWHADDSRLQHIRMLDDDVFDVARIDIESPGYDHVLFAIDEGEKAIRIEFSDVAGSDEALAGAVKPFGIHTLAGLIVIARHHRFRMPDDLAGLAGWNLVAVLADEADIMADYRPPDRTQFVLVSMRFQDADSAAFGHPIEPYQTARPPLEHIRLQLGRERGRCREFHDEAREVVPVEVGQRHNAVVLHGNEHCVSHAVFGSQLHEAPCV